MPAGSKTDPPLAKAEPISDGGSASVITYLRRGGENLLHNSSQKRGVRICERNNSADTKVSEEGGGGGAPGTRAKIPLQPMVKTMVKQAVPLQPMEVNSGADIHPAACGGPHTGAGGCALKEAVTLWREDLTLEQVCWQDL
ncbi:acid sphingomyelinase-like phosphodiesterase 3b [Grus japonensis]|uniref:Acid sphingomyelinase-like phosphodiesterase 3b n=1 Tax=Grus japonensis TaxID=30415 RepID=A0ABC9YIV3_GRUJA